MKAAPTPTEDVTIGNQARCAKKTELLTLFPRRYDWRFPIDLTPSGHAFILIVRARKKRGTELIPLSRFANVVDTKDNSAEHVRIKGTNGDLISTQPNR